VLNNNYFLSPLRLKWQEIIHMTHKLQVCRTLACTVSTYQQRKQAGTAAPSGAMLAVLASALSAREDRQNFLLA
jgi:hypothetical protein